ncbi:MAG: hypothetical protein H0V41_02895 [Pseudonocardiales bacterium]|nr:hypothetical protein [Pseudonocardiales bacterium]
MSKYPPVGPSAATVASATMISAPCSTVWWPRWLGVLELDCDVLLGPDADQVIVVYSASPGTQEAESLALLRVLGIQQLAPGERPPSPELDKGAAGRPLDGSAGEFGTGRASGVPDG